MENNLKPFPAGKMYAEYLLSPKNPLIFPLYGDLKGLPPIKIYVGDKEILRDEAFQFLRGKVHS
jgi:acetyl esterase/lipase